MIQEHIFRKYDIRATVGKDFLIEDIYELTQSIACFLQNKDPKCKDIVVAMDGRIHSLAIKEQVVNALIDAGINVSFIGLCTTPAMYFATHVLNVHAGIMITASHNPWHDNGLKIVLNKEPVWDEQIEQIKSIYYSKNAQINNNEAGTYQEVDIVDLYTNYLAKEFYKLQGNTLRIAIDCGNGTAGSILPTLIKKLDLKNVKLIFDDIDGKFPNHEPDPTKEKNLIYLKDFLSKNNVDFALAFDGDCDRVAAMTNKGFLIPGDQLLAIFAKFVDTTKSKHIVFDVKCSNGLVKQLNAHNLIANICPTGIGYVKQQMKKTHAVLGGELSGHICFKDRYFGFDDGIYAAMRLIEIVATQGQSLEQLISDFPKLVSSPEYRIKCAEKQKNEVINGAKKILSNLDNSTLTEVDGIRIDTLNGWGLLRASNTESLLSLRFEGDTPENMNKIKLEFYLAMKNYFDNNFLKEQLQIIEFKD